MSSRARVVYEGRGEHLQGYHLRKRGRTEAQYDKDLKNFIFVVFEESDTRIGGNESIHTILPTEAHVLDAAAVAPEKEREIVMLVAGAVVKYRSPPIRQQTSFGLLPNAFETSEQPLNRRLKRVWTLTLKIPLGRRTPPPPPLKSAPTSRKYPSSLAAP